MKLEIHWPDDRGVKVTDTCWTDTNDDCCMFLDLIDLSSKYDVIIDNGKVTFVDKE